jgi:mediator of replication checkpoint protein 1
MTVNRDYSIVADSTCSPSSPSSAFLPSVRRPVRTNGSPKSSDDPDSSLIYPPSSLASRDSIYRTGPPDLDEQVPPSSDISHSLSDNELADDEDEDSPHDASGKGFFGWREKLQKLDKSFDSDVEEQAISDIPDVSPSERPLATQPLSPQRVQSIHVPTSPAVVTSNALTQDVFGMSLSTLTASSLSQSAFAKSPSSLTPQVIPARRRFKKRVVRDSDSESDNKGSPATPSPAFPHAISTPKSRSSPTPPTSDDDEMPAYPMHEYTSKGKGKVNPTVSRPTVVPLQFSEGSNGLSVASKKSMRKDRRNKKSKIKVSYYRKPH